MTSSDSDRRFQPGHTPKFQYWSITYHYPDGRVVTSGAYADEGMAKMNASLNASLRAEVTEIWY